MTYTIKRYQNYQEYLDDETLVSDGNYRLLSTGEVIEVPLENDANAEIISILFAALLQSQGFGFAKFIRPGNKEIQVSPTGDNCVNCKPDLMVITTEHREATKQAILFGMSAPTFVAEVVSPGNESSDNYLRDYVWKRQQYESWQIPEYWIIDPHRAQVSVLTLIDKSYRVKTYQGKTAIASKAFPMLQLTAALLI